MLTRWFGPPDIPALETRRDIRGLARASAHKDHGIRRAACESLGRLGDRSALAALVIALKNDPSTDVRVAACEALARMNAREGIDALLHVPDTERYVPDRVQTAAREALAELAGTYSGDLVQALKSERRAVRDTASVVLLRMSHPPLEALVAALADGGRGRAEVLDILTRHPHTAAVEPLTKLLADRDPALRCKAAAALAATKDPRTVATLIDALGDQDVAVRAEAARALGTFQAPAAVEPLLQALDDEPDVMAAAALALAPSKDGRAVDRIVERMKAGLPRQHCHAIATALGQLGDPRAVDTLLSMLCDEETALQAQLQDKYAGYGLDTAVVETVLTALAQLRDPRAMRVVIARLSSNLSYDVGDRDSRETIFPVRRAAESVIRDLDEDAFRTLQDALGDEARLHEAMRPSRHVAEKGP